MANRELTNEEKTIYENSKNRLINEIKDIDLQIRLQQLTVDEVLAYNYKVTRKREEEQLKLFKSLYEEKKMALDDCIDKLEKGVEEK